MYRVKETSQKNVLLAILPSDYYQSLQDLTALEIYGCLDFSETIIMSYAPLSKEC